MEKRENFGTRLGFILVSAGCAVGLGNVWKFPYICGQNGGAAFILLYLACLAVLGLPILICEYAVGRASRHSVAKAFSDLEPEHTNWHRFGWFGIAGNYLLMMFYTMVAGWMINYALRMLTGRLSGMETEQIAEQFTNMLASPTEMMLFMVIAVLLSFGVCSLGLQNGVERITKIMMLLLICLMIVLAVHSLMLPNMKEGLAFYLVPDVSKFSEIGFGNVLFAAMSHAFFTLSVGMGSMEIFGSYLDKSRSLTGEALSVLGLDTFVALMAGIIIIPACFAYGVQPDSGPPLLFITLPNVFNHMAGGQIWGTAFFIFMSFAALSTVIAVFENILSMTMETFNWNRKKAVRYNIVGVIILSIPAVLGYNVLSGIQPIGAGSTIMDLEDFLVSYNILPLGSLLFVLFCTKKNGWGWDNFLQEADTGEGIKFPAFIRHYVHYGVPALIAVIYLKGYYDMFSKYGTATLVFWMCVAVAFLALIFSFTTSKRKR
ncbi:sodium-dependent transporter [Butyricicoccus sp.]|uniref:sodium-dependent transporter n=1 Tax=Butyricicoccus sp. TaxID=2049021 RepID=UPI003F188E20